MDLSGSIASAVLEDKVVTMRACHAFCDIEDRRFFGARSHG